ncbi:SAF domain-containing protein [Lachnospira multipara]|uniref:SAF domain-containing protein n=1 Tax=Lachnospira multipara TaxID=28051 RepID=UPI0004804CFF|nr:SAF domain-containing protein [Lachnospira multipara]
MADNFYREDELIDIENQEAKKEDKAKRKEKRNGKLSIAIIAGLVSIVIASLSYWLLLSAENRVLSEYDRTSVYVLSSDIAAGTQITDKSYFTEKQIDSSVVPENAITDLSQIKDTYALYDLSKNTVLTDNMFYSINDAENGTKEIGISLSSLTSGVNGIIRESDYIDLYIYTGNTNSSNLTSTSETTVINNNGSVTYLNPGESISTEGTVDTSLSVSPTYKRIYVSKAFTSDGVRISNSDTTSITSRINIVVPESDADYITGAILNGASISATICTE